MLSAYRANTQAPAGHELRHLIEQLKNGGEETLSDFAPTFAWSEYEHLVVAQTGNGKPLFNVAIQIDPACAMPFAAVQLVQNVLSQLGTVLVMHPESASVDVAQIEAVVATDRPQDAITQKCKVPAITSAVVVRPYESANADPFTIAMPNGAGESESALDDVLGLADAVEAAPVSNSAAIPIPAPAISVAVPVATVVPVREEPAPQEREKQSAPVATENILRVDADRIDAVLNLVGELIIGKSMLHQSIQEFGKRFPKDPLRGKFADMLAFQSQVLNELQRSVMKIRMVPVEQLFRRFPRIVRDVAKQENKDVKLVINGGDTDLDKSILDSLAEPMMHLVRNAVDHGIESPMDRLAVGKTVQASITLDAYHQGNHVVIEVSDDGRGIDPQRVMARAIERGVVTAEEASHMTDAEIVELIFEPGFSTAEKVTEISGRGVGLDVVKTVLERMKGSVSVKSEPGQGSRFLLKVPLTLAIIRALLFRVGAKLYAVPLASVNEITRAHESEIHRIDGHEVLRIRDQVLTLVRLSRMDRTYERPAKGDKVFVIVVAQGERKFGLIVDRLVAEEELVIKAIDDHLVATELVSGASILGDGTVVLILNLAAVVEKLVRTRVSNASTNSATAKGAHA
jgi:two-component system chemotaxis sensor kinase CheA